MRSKDREQYFLHVDDGGRIIRSIRSQKDPKKNENLWGYVGLVGDLGIAVVLPIAIGAFIGGKIDENSGSYPRYTISLLIGGSIISIVSFIQIIQAIIRQKK